jgi:Holliday junction DNA helicase RuvA
VIARIQGILESVEGSVALVALPGGLAYEVLVSAYTAARLGGSIGQPVKFETLHFVESQNQGSTLLPRLAGFLTAQDRQFFELFTTAKGIGNKRALRAMTLASDQIAAAIADRDLTLLQSLPEIGKRTAETIVATLHGKVDKFISAAAYGENAATRGASTPPPTGARALAREALEVLLQLGENRVQALSWIDEVLRGEERPTDVQDLIARVYRIKAR